MEVADKNRANASIIWKQHGECWEEIVMLKQGESKAQGLVEYAMIMMLVVIIVMVVLVLLGPATGNLFSNVMYNF